MDWLAALDLPRALANVRSEFPGDWHQDPWGWPELQYIANKRQDLIVDNCKREGARASALLTVPKEGWGTRPAVVLDPLDRLMYQALVDRRSVDLIGETHRDVFGWRLELGDPSKGEYTKNSTQWDEYRHHLRSQAGWTSAALRTDLVSFFASIPIEGVSEALQDRCSLGADVQRLTDFLGGFQSTPQRSGLPQRSLASAVIANMYLRPIDDVLIDCSFEVPIQIGEEFKHRTFARWMDDMWLFGLDPAKARQCQMRLHVAAQDLGLNLNSSKTEVIEGEEIASAVLEIEHSAVDDAIKRPESGDDPDLKPLEELIDRVLAAPSEAARTTIRFCSRRMRDTGSKYRIADLMAVAAQMPHGADSLARLLKERFEPGSLQEWYLDYTESNWATFQWSVAGFGRMFSTEIKPSKPLIEFFADAVRSSDTELPLRALAAQRLSVWDAPGLRAAVNDAQGGIHDPHSRRVLSLAALTAGEGRAAVKKWLKLADENQPTFELLESKGWKAPRVQIDFAT